MNEILINIVGISLFKRYSILILGENTWIINPGVLTRTAKTKYRHPFALSIGGGFPPSPAL